MVRRTRAFQAAGLIFALLNLVVWRHARAMLRFRPPARGRVSGRTPQPEDLSGWAKLVTMLAGLRIPRPLNDRTPAAVGLPYRVLRIPLRPPAFLEAWATDHQAARGVVLLFPGYAASKAMLLAPAAEFHRLGYATLLVDFQGVGGSSGSDTTLGWREAGDVAHAVRFAADAWPGRPIVLYGVSLGAAAILRAVAREGIRPAGLILESPFDRLLSAVRNRFRSLGLPAFPAAEWLLLWGSVQLGYNGFRHNPVADARRVSCPALVFHGQRDPRATPEQVAAVCANLAGAAIRVPIAGAGHELLAEAAPARWRAEVARFLVALDRSTN